MSGDNKTVKNGLSQRIVEIWLAIFFAAFGAIIVYGAIRAGITWGFDGPRAGFFPFIVGSLTIIGALITLYQVVTDKSDLGVFAEWAQLTQVGSVALPTLAYIIFIYLIGIYIASALLIAYFMLVLSRFSIRLTAAVSILMPIVTYFFFERWFLVSLPQGLYGERITDALISPIGRLFGL
jgi:putative tricarboxylic transport membrane protein